MILLLAFFLSSFSNLEEVTLNVIWYQMDTILTTITCKQRLVMMFPTLPNQDISVTTLWFLLITKKKV